LCEMADREVGGLASVTQGRYYHTRKRKKNYLKTRQPSKHPFLIHKKKKKKKKKKQHPKKKTTLDTRPHTQREPQSRQTDPAKNKTHKENIRKTNIDRKTNRLGGKGTETVKRKTFFIKCTGLANRREK